MEKKARLLVALAINGFSADSYGQHKLQVFRNFICQ
jgi:hypothetical protein